VHLEILSEFATLHTATVFGLPITKQSLFDCRYIRGTSQTLR